MALSQSSGVGRTGEGGGIISDCISATIDTGVALAPTGKDKSLAAAAIVSDGAQLDTSVFQIAAPAFLILVTSAHGILAAARTALRTAVSH